MPLLWVGYGTGVAAGLMAIGHATGIVESAGLNAMLWIAPALTGIFNMGGSFLGGWLADRLRPGRLLPALALLTTFALLLLWAGGSVTAALVGLALVGLSYGATIAAYPAVITKMTGPEDGPRIYGQVFTAWGTAGLFAPWFAGLLYDRAGDYALAFVIAAGLSLLSAGAALWLARVRG